MDDSLLIKTIDSFLSEDVGSGDVTSAFTPNRRVKAQIISNSDGFISGVCEVRLLFKNHGVKVTAHVKDGGAVSRGQVVLTLSGMSFDILVVERTALNFLSRMSGITTKTRRYADVLKSVGSHSRVVATRKTTPGLRYFEKRAVVLGGGLPHRMGLYDMILIKDNHLALFGGDVSAALAAAKSSGSSLKVEVEVSCLRDGILAVEGGADIVMFDNMSPKKVKAAVSELKRMGLRKKVLLEASGGVNIKNIGAFGLCGVDWISTGRLTQSAPYVDFSLEFVVLR